MAGIALAVGAVVGVLKYTKRDKDVEGNAKSFKNKVERKGEQAPFFIQTLHFPKEAICVCAFCRWAMLSQLCL